MANLGLIRWQKYAPDVGNNRELPSHQQLVLEVAVGLTKLQLQSLRFTLPLTPAAPDETDEQKAAREAADEAAGLDLAASVWGAFVRLKGDQHTVGDKKVSDLRSYLGAVPATGVYEVGRILRHLNSLTGAEELFSERSSGGLSTTGDR